jgi:hypothetical protein
VKRLIHFFSLAVMTQAILMLGQLILLPIQIRLWGPSATAMWYSALALATITLVADCGLRTAGHAELMQAGGNTAAFQAETAQFRQIWSWIRILILIVTAALIGCDIAAGLLFRQGGYPVWRIALILACALESVLIIRISYLDTLGRYRGAEASYFGFASLRLALSVPALLIFHWNPPGLAAIYLVTAAVTVFAQGHWLCNSNSLLRLTDKFPTLSWKALTLARYTIAEPSANWARLSLPVLVLGQIASPMAVITYVALRAIFGAGRTTIQQLARVASVEFLKSRSNGDAERAESLLTVFTLAAIFFSASVGLFVVIDNLRVVGLWLRHSNRELYRQIALAFALTAPFFAYQIPMSIMMRTGQLAFVARRNYAFIACSAVFACLSLLVKELPVYLALLVTAELLLSVSFFAPGRAATVLNESRAGLAGLKVAFTCSLTIAVFWLTARQNVDVTIKSMTHSFILFLTTTFAIAATLFAFFGSNLKLLRRAKWVEPSITVAK